MLTAALIALLGLFAFFLVLVIVAIPTMGGGMMGAGMMGGAMLGMPFLGAFFMLGLPLLFGGAAVLLVIAVARGAASAVQMGSPSQSGASPLDILKVRFAKGEINQEQFNAMRRHVED